MASHEIGLSLIHWGPKAQLLLIFQITIQFSVICQTTVCIGVCRRADSHYISMLPLHLPDLQIVLMHSRCQT